MSQQVEITVVADWETFAGLKCRWNDLLTQSKADTFFLAWEWVYSWAKCFLGRNRNLFILCVYKGRELVAIAPWCIRHTRLGIFRVRQIEFLATPEGGSDYLDIIAKRGHEREIAGVIYRFLFEDVREQWDLLSLSDIPADSLFLHHLLAIIDKAGKYFSINPAAFCPITVLPNTWENFLTSLSRNRREQFRRHRRLLEEQGDFYHRTIVHSCEQQTSALEEFWKLYKDRWPEADDTLYTFIIELIAQQKSHDWLQIDFLEVGDKKVGGLLHFICGERVLMYLMAIDRAFSPKISIGNIIVGLCIERAINTRRKYYDFLKGDESYKFHWSNTGRSSLKLVVPQRRMVTLWMLLERWVRNTAKLLVR